MYVYVTEGRTDMRVCEVNTTKYTCTYRNRLQNTFSDVTNRTVQKDVFGLHKYVPHPHIIPV